MDKFIKVTTAESKAPSATDNNGALSIFKDPIFDLGPEFDPDIEFPGLEEGYNAGGEAAMPDFSLDDLEKLVNASPPTTQKMWARITKNETNTRSSQAIESDKQVRPLITPLTPPKHAKGKPNNAIAEHEEPTGTPVSRAPSRRESDEHALSTANNMSTLLDLGEDEEQYMESPDNINYFAMLVNQRLAYTKPGNSCEFERYWDVYNEERLKCRPKGAVDFFNPFKNGKSPCCCGCSSRNKKNTAPSEVYKDGVLNGFRRTGWLTPKHPYVALLVPNSTPVLGRLLFDIYSEDERYDTITIQDLVTGNLYCCPLAWLFSVCMHLFSNRLVSNPEEMMDSIAGHMRSSTMGYRFLYVLDLKCHLHQLSFAYRHFINMHTMRRTIVKGKCVAVRPNLDNVDFPDRTEIAKLFENSDSVIRNEDELWNYALRRRLVHVKDTLGMYQKYFLLNSRAVMPSSVCGAVLKMSLRHLFFVDAIVDELANACLKDKTSSALMITNGPDNDKDTHPQSDEHSESSKPTCQQTCNSEGRDNDEVEDKAYPEDRPEPPCDPDLLACPCNCDFTGPPDPDTFEELSAMAMMRWVHFGMQVFLRMPHMTPVPGVLYLWKRNKHDENIPCPEFLDLETGQRYCCARAWIYGTYMYLYSEGRITSSPITVCEVRKALRSKFYASECVYIPEYGVPMSHLLNCYRMGIQARLSDAAEQRQRCPQGPYRSAQHGEYRRASFLARDEMLMVKGLIPDVAWPDENPYMLRLRDEIATVETKIDNCRAAVTNIVGSTSHAVIAQRLVALPLYTWRTVADLLHVVDEKAHADFYTHQP